MIHLWLALVVILSICLTVVVYKFRESYVFDALSRLIIGVRRVTLSTEVSSGIRVVEDFSLTRGEYKALSSSPVGYDAKKNQAESGFIVEVGDTERNSKFILFYKDKIDFIDEFHNMNNMDDEKELLGSLLSIGRRGEVTCWICGDNVNSIRSQSGDELKVYLGFIGYCASSRIGSSSHICSTCCNEIHKAVLENDTDVVESSDLVLEEI